MNSAASMANPSKRVGTITTRRRRMNSAASMANPLKRVGTIVTRFNVFCVAGREFMGPPSNEFGGKYGKPVDEG
jgi:hypothetical protein